MWRSLNKLQFQTAWSLARCAHDKKFDNTHQLQLCKYNAFKENSTPQKCIHKQSSDGKEKDYSRTKKGNAFNFVRNDCLEVFGWSGIIFLSWYMWFPCCPRRIASNPAERYAYKCLTRNSSQDYSSLVKSLSTLILDSPVNYVLPKVSATKSRHTSLTEVDESEALRKGCENLETAHRNVTSSLSNWLGTECMQSGKYEEAFRHFSDAASSNDAAAFFNMGLCHEMGLGTNQSFKRAAEFYKKASDLGHATAMYNLGVFHVHGWGGLESNTNEARLLFEAAALLGQGDAMKALNWENDHPSESESDSADETSQNEQQSFFHDVVEPRDNDLTELWLKVLKIELDNNKTQPTLVPKSERLLSVDSGINELSPTNELDVFLRS